MGSLDKFLIFFNEMGRKSELLGMLKYLETQKI